MQSSNDPLPNLGSLIKNAKGGYEVSDHQDIDEFDRYLPADLLCPLRALQHMPSVRIFGISDRRRSDSEYW